jgi:hypothetical protein
VDVIGQRVRYIERYEPPMPGFSSWQPVYGTGTVQSLVPNDPRRMVNVLTDGGGVIVESGYLLQRIEHSA